MHKVSAYSGRANKIKEADFYSQIVLMPATDQLLATMQVLFENQEQLHLTLSPVNCCPFLRSYTGLSLKLLLS